MQHPYYTFTVASLTRGWTYSAVEGEGWDPADDVVLLSPFTYNWSFKNGLLPAQMEALTATLVLAAREASDVPEVQLGDLIQFSVRVGTAGPFVIAPPPMRASAPDVELVPSGSTLGGVYSARLTIALTDLSPDWRSASIVGPLAPSTSTTTGLPRYRWRERLAELAVMSGVSIGCPAWWDNYEGPNFFEAFLKSALTIKPDSMKGDLEKLLESLANSHQPDSLTHTWMTVYAPTGHPVGYRPVGPDTWETDVLPVGALGDPASVVRVEAVPASRRAPGTIGLPLTLEVVDGLITVVPRPDASTGSTVTQLGLDADWCDVPARARRARETATNRVLINLQSWDPTDELDSVGARKYQMTYLDRTFDNAGDIVSRGVVARAVDTALVDFTASDGHYLRGALPPLTAPAEAAANFLSDSSALNGPWTYDAFTVYGGRMPQDVAEYILPRLAPRLPDEPGGDGRLVRAVTVFDLDKRIRFGNEAVNGFIVSGQLQIVGGDLRWTLTTAPGRPVWSSSPPPPMSVKNFQDEWGSYSYDELDTHSLKYADLVYVE